MDIFKNKRNAAQGAPVQRVAPSGDVNVAWHTVPTKEELYRCVGAAPVRRLFRVRLECEAGV
jgi:hypothetical protein